MTIARAEDWLVAVCQDAAGSSVTVTHAPHTWDGEYTKKLLGNLPAVVISWEGGSCPGVHLAHPRRHMDGLRGDGLAGR